ncbi:hypothetical protein MHLP_02030 [Candidatus Mycoplasma haematolamae str. Purdue]|uniref:Uncharacterized protein n=1 Tax=Mycoplasma haematolamae (strain Purdue) TaxID=1212765 RepID=I7CFK2_MYCHA|nr:hypothetical protein [Candidatus Mycoplasma haematolamae]AFO51986.1 hypothetical protein MHLP_02030 [Candidatus Mycoplasma haematolamae str. Purdue]
MALISPKIAFLSFAGLGSTAGKGYGIHYVSTYKNPLVLASDKENRSEDSLQSPVNSSTVREDGKLDLQTQATKSEGEPIADLLDQEDEDEDLEELAESPQILKGQLFFTKYRDDDWEKDVYELKSNLSSEKKGEVVGKQVEFSTTVSTSSLDALIEGFNVETSFLFENIDEMLKALENNRSQFVSAFDLTTFNQLEGVLQSFQILNR